MSKRKDDTQGSLSRRGVLLAAGGAGAGAALAACGSSDAPAVPSGMGAFAHGVASGDPLADRVVIWTRVTPEAHAEPSALAQVSWQVASDPQFTQMVDEGVATTNASRDWTVKRDVAGLSPGAEYYYRFSHGGTTSPVGRTKTLPVGAVDSLRMAVFSCSNYPFGYFNAYRHMADGDPVDVVLHLGDYIYEYGPDGYGGEQGEKLGRPHMPAKEIVTLDEYRQRHAQYKTDPNLQAAHAAAPWITIWDDHESTNNSTRDDAQNHQPETEGDWTERKAAAVRAYFEWMPIREPEAGKARAAIWRSFEFGDLASLVMLETRLTARSDEITLDMLPIPDDAADGDETVQADVDAFLAERVGAPDRELLGAEQLGFVGDVLAASRAAGKPWQIFGNQVIMAKVQAPDYTVQLPGYVRQIAKRDALVWNYLQKTRFHVPANLDAWDAFPAERERLYDVAKAAGANLVTFTGDTHNFWVNELRAEDDTRMGCEFGTTGVTSPSAFERLKAPGLHAGRLVEATNSSVHMHEPYDKGYVIAEFTPDAVKVDFVVVNTITSPTFKAKIAYSYTARPGGDGVDGTLVRNSGS